MRHADRFNLGDPVRDRADILIAAKLAVLALCLAVVVVGCSMAFPDAAVIDALAKDQASVCMP